MKKLLLLCCLCAGMKAAGQQVFVELGRVNSSFDFTNSQGEMLENLQSVSNTYLGVGYKHRFFTDDLHISLGLNYNSYGATGSDDSVNNFFEWEVDYIGVNLNFDYDFLEYKGFKAFAKAGVSLEFLASGTQRINNQTINLVKEEEFDNNAFFLRAGGGVSYPIFEGGRLYAQYLWGQSLPLEDDSPESGEELVINTNMFGIGLIVDLFKKKDAVQTEQEETNTTD